MKPIIFCLLLGALLVRAGRQVTMKCQLPGKTELITMFSYVPREQLMKVFNYKYCQESVDRTPDPTPNPVYSSYIPANVPCKFVKNVWNRDVLSCDINTYLSPKVPCQFKQDDDVTDLVCDASRFPNKRVPSDVPCSFTGATLACDLNKYIPADVPCRYRRTFFKGIILECTINLPRNCAFTKDMMWGDYLQCN